MVQDLLSGKLFISQISEVLKDPRGTCYPGFVVPFALHFCIVSPTLCVCGGGGEVGVGGVSHFSLVQLLETLWTVAHQVPVSMGFSRQEYWGGLLCPPPRIFLTQGLCLLHWHAGSLPLALPWKSIYENNDG